MSQRFFLISFILGFENLSLNLLKSFLIFFNFLSSKLFSLFIYSDSLRTLNNLSLDMLLQSLMPLLFATSFNSFNDRFSILILQRKNKFFTIVSAFIHLLWLLPRWLLLQMVASADGCFFDNGRLANFEQVKNGNHFADFEQVKINSYFVNFEQVKIDGYFVNVKQDKIDNQ